MISQPAANTASAAAPRRISRLDLPPMAAAACGIAVWVCASSAIAFGLMFSSLPFVDGWDYWRQYDYRIEHPLRWMLAQHSEHRFTTARLLYLLDDYVFQGRSIFLVICTPS